MYKMTVPYDGDYELWWATQPGSQVVSLDPAPNEGPVYVSVSYVTGPDRDAPEQFALLQGLDTPVWLSDSGKECPEGFEESCRLAYKVGRARVARPAVRMLERACGAQPAAAYCSLSSQQLQVHQK